MKPTIKNFEVKKRGGFVDLPPKGAYVAEIKNVLLTEDRNGREILELMLDICEGEYENRYTEVWKDQKERFGDDVKFKGIFRLTPPADGDPDWRERVFSENLWCVEQSNDGYSWDWDEKKLKGKKVGISVRNRMYTYNGQDRQTTEIAQFELVKDVRNGKCKPVKDRDQREKREESTDGSDFTDVSKNVDVPWA